MEVSTVKSHDQWTGNRPIPTTIGSESLRSYVRPEYLQLPTALIHNPTLTISFLAMEGGTYSLLYPGVFAINGGRTDPLKEDSLAYPYDPQISEEVPSRLLSRRDISTDTDI